MYIFTYRYISGGLKRLVILGNLLWVFVGVAKSWLVIISQFWIIAGSQICLFQSSCQLRMKNEIMIFPLKQKIAKIDHYRNPYHSTSTSWTMKSVGQHSVLNVSLGVSSFLKTSIQSCGSRISGLCPAITHYVVRLHPVTRIHLKCIYMYIYRYMEGLSKMVVQLERYPLRFIWFKLCFWDHTDPNLRETIEFTTSDPRVCDQDSHSSRSRFGARKSGGRTSRLTEFLYGKVDLGRLIWKGFCGWLVGYFREVVFLYSQGLREVKLVWVQEVFSGILKEECWQ